MNAVVLAPEPAQDVPTEGYLARQPILDRTRRLMGFELFYRSGREGPVEPMVGAQCTAALLADLFAAVGLEEALGGLNGFVNADAVFLNSHLVELLPPHRVVLELTESVTPDPETLRRLKVLRQEGYRLALDNYWGEFDRIQPLLPFVSYVKADLEWIEAKALGLVARPFQGGKVRLIASKVETAEQFQEALAHGFELFQGYHFAKPQTMHGKRSPVDAAGLMRLMALVTTDAGDERLEEELQRQPGMSVNLLRLVNSAASGLRTPVKSLREAVYRMGRRPLATWLQLLLYTSDGNLKGDPLLHTAALRGKLMELLAQEMEPGDRTFVEGAMMVGILSLMHVVFGQTQAAFAAGLGLDESVRQALDARSGRFGRLLALIERREAGTDASTGPVHPATFARFEVEALRWASEITSGR